MGKTKNFYIVLIILACTILYAQVIGLERGGTLLLEPSAFLSSLDDGWHVEEVNLRDFEEAVLRPDCYLYLRYRSSDFVEPIYVFLGYFRDQRIGIQIHSPINCLPGSGWNVVRADEYGAPGLDFQIRRLVAERSGEYREVYYWFVTSSGVTCSEYMLKLAQLKSGLLLRSKDALFVRISVSGDGDEARSRMEAFIPRFAEVLEVFLVAGGWNEEVLRSTLAGQSR